MITQHLRVVAMSLATSLCLVFVPHLTLASNVAATSDAHAMMMIVCPDMIVTTEITGSTCETFVNIPIPTSNDPSCPIVQQTNNTGQMDPSGIYPDTSFMITYDVEDACGITMQCMQLVIVEDDTEPVLIPPADSVSFTLPPEPADLDAFVMAGGIASDVCSIDSASYMVTTIVQSVSGFTTTYERQFSLADIYGNTEISSQFIIVSPSTTPLLICPPDTTGECDLNSVAPFTLFNQFIEPSIGGDLQPQEVLDTIDRSTFHLVRTDTLPTTGCPAYDRIYGIRLMDDTLTCTQRVQIIDNDVPVIGVCMKDTTVYTDAMSCEAMIMIDTTGMLISDNCDIDTIINTMTNGGADASATYPLGSTDVTFTVFDGCGNTSSCALTVTVLDTLGPVLTAPNDTIIDCDISNYDYQSIDAFFNNGGSAEEGCSIDSTSYNTSIVQTSTGDCPTVYEITYMLADTIGNMDTSLQVVTVVDTIAPTIDSIPPMVLYTGPNDCTAASVLPTVTASDNCTLADTTNDLNAALDSLIVFDLDTTKVEIYVHDQCNNQDTVEVCIIVRDTIAPVVVGDPAQAFAVCGMMEVDTLMTVDDALAEGLQITDNCTLMDSLTLDSVVSSMVQVERFYTVTDESGNQTNFSQVIVLQDFDPPMLEIARDTTIACTSDTLSFFATVPTSATDNCEVVDTVVSGPFVLNSNPCNYQLGVSFTVTDQMGNMARDTQIVTVVDTVAPAISPLVGLSDIYCAAPLPAAEAPTITDACSPTLPLIVNIDETRRVACADYPVIYEYIAFDNCNNTDTLWDTIMVLRDSIAPELLAPMDTLMLTTDANDCVATHQLVAPAAQDDCSSGVIATPDFAGNTFDLDTTIINWTFADQCGNDTIIPQVVVVNDDKAPTILVSGPKIVAISNNVPACIPADTFAHLFYDNCTKESAIKITGMKIDGDGNPITTCGDTSTQLRETLCFCCEDIGQDVFLMLQAEDLRGNTNLTAAFRVTVVDKVGPISGPTYDLPDVTISCDYDLDLADLSAFGGISFDINGRDSVNVEGTFWGFDAFVLDNCGAMTTVTDTIVMDNRNDCGQGDIIRHLIVDDGANTPLIIEQVITVVDNSPFTLSDITFPADYTLDDCGATMVLPDVSGIPTFINDDQCADIFYNFDDQIFNQQDGTIAINRTWTVIDWCQYNPALNQGVWTDDQKVNIICSSGRVANVGGSVRNAHGEPMAGVQLTLEGPEMEAVVVSDSTGQWDFSTIPAAYSYAVSPSYDKDHLAGVSTLDLVKIMRHILGIEALGHPSNIVAGDINDDQRLSGADIVALRRVILGQVEGFENNTSYRFVAPGYEWSEEEDYWNWQESWITPSLESDEVTLDFEAIKIGDVDQSQLSENRSDRNVGLTLSTPYRLQNGDYAVDISVGEATQLHAMEVSFASKEIVDIKGGALDIDDWYHQDEQGIHIAWAHALPVELHQGQRLFTVVLQSEDGLQLDLAQRSEAYDDAGQRLDLTVNTEASGKILSLAQNQPNPFSNLTEIKWTQDKTSQVQLILHDANGGMIHKHRATYDAGQHTYVVTAADIDPTHGVIFYSISIDGTEPITKKMLRIE